MSFKQSVFLIFFSLFCIIGSFSEQKLYPFIPFNMYSEFNPNQIKVVRLKVADKKSVQYIDIRHFISSSLTENDALKIIMNLKERDKKKLALLIQEITKTLQAKNKERILEVKIIIRYFERIELEKTSRVRDVELY